MRHVHGVLLATLLAACGHSEPFPTGPWPGDGPFDQVEPIRLTFSTGEDAWPFFSADGRWLSYRFSRGTPDRDYCAGILPAGGGQRFEDICAWERDEASRSDDFRALVRVGEDRMAFTRHSSGIGNAAPSDAGLYVAPLSRERDAVKVLDLFTRPAGASDTWSYLIDPVWVGGDDLLVLASKAFIGQTVPFGPVDTVYQGVEIARVDLGSVPAIVTPVVAATNAVAWAYDPGTATVWFHRRYYAVPPGSGATSVVADTIFRAPAGGGAAVAAYGRPASNGVSPIRLDGFAVAGGALFVAQSYERFFPAVPACLVETWSDLWRVAPDGGLENVLVESSCTGNRWLRLAGAPERARLVGARFLVGQRDLYLFELD